MKAILATSLAAAVLTASIGVAAAQSDRQQKPMPQQMQNQKGVSGSESGTSSFQPNGAQKQGDVNMKATTSGQAKGSIGDKPVTGATGSTSQPAKAKGDEQKK